MNKIVWAVFATIIVYFVSLIVISPIISSIGYSSVESSYHALTHAILLSLIFVVIVSAMVILEEIDAIKKKIDERKE